MSLHILPKFPSCLLLVTHPRYQSDGKGDDVREFVLTLHLMDHPVEACLSVDRSNEDLPFVTIDEGGKSLERDAVGVHGHAEDDNIRIGNNLGRVRAELRDPPLVSPRDLLRASALHFANDTVPVPVVRPSRQQVHAVSGFGQERNKDVR